MTTIQEIKEKILLEYAEDKWSYLSTSKQVEIWNTYCSDAGNCDDEVFENDDNFLEEMFSSKDEVARAIYYGDFNYTDKYIRFNAYGNLETTNDPSGWLYVDSDFFEWYIVDDDLEDELDVDDLKQAVAKEMCIDVENLKDVDLDYFDTIEELQEEIELSKEL